MYKKVHHKKVERDMNRQEKLYVMYSNLSNNALKIKFKVIDSEMIPAINAHVLTKNKIRIEEDTKLKDEYMNSLKKLNGLIDEYYVLLVIMSEKGFLIGDTLYKRQDILHLAENVLIFY